MYFNGVKQLDCNFQINLKALLCIIITAPSCMSYVRMLLCMYLNYIDISINNKMKLIPNLGREIYLKNAF